MLRKRVHLVAVCIMSFIKVGHSTSLNMTCEGTGLYYPCPIGCYNTAVRATNNYETIITDIYSDKSDRVCSVVPSGHYSPAINDELYACPAGTYSTEGSGNCTSCPRGSYTYSEGSGSCFECPPGSYSSVVGSSTCSYCHPKQYNGFGSYSVQRVKSDPKSIESLECLPPSILSDAPSHISLQSTHPTPSKKVPRKTPVLPPSRVPKESYTASPTYLRTLRPSSTKSPTRHPTNTSLPTYVQQSISPKPFSSTPTSSWSTTPSIASSQLLEHTLEPSETPTTFDLPILYDILWNRNEPEYNRTQREEERKQNQKEELIVRLTTVVLAGSFLAIIAVFLIIVEKVKQRRKMERLRREWLRNRPIPPPPPLDSLYDTSNAATATIGNVLDTYEIGSTSVGDVLPVTHDNITSFQLPEPKAE